MPQSERVAEVWAALEPVTDPELDESVVQLGFVERVAVEAEGVSVSFRLPTFWCSANFAFMMAEDMRDALARLVWAEAAEIRLVDHFAAEKINAAIAEGQNFGEIFGGSAAEDLRVVRETFRRKAYLGRMSALIEALRQDGRVPAAVLAMRVGQIEEWGRAGGSAGLAHRFLERRAEFGGPAEPREPAFRKPEGACIHPDELRDYLREIRMARRRAEANGEMCRMLLKARQDFPVPPDESTLAAVS